MSRWPDKQIDRRRFVQASAIAALGVRGLFAAAQASAQRPPEFAFVGVKGSNQGVHVYAIGDRHWQPLHFVPSEAPVALALHPSCHSLYVLNEVSEYRGLPLGTVEAYRIDRRSGQLTLLNLQPLALSAILPRNMAISPDGTILAIAVHGGGAYNTLPILPNGRLGRMRGVLKETGSGPVAEHQQTAHPQSVAFDATGTRWIAADLGCDRLSVFSLSKTSGGLIAHNRRELPPGSGPRHLALHPDGNLLYVDHALDGSASGFHYDPATGLIGEQCASARGAFGDALAIHPRGNFLYSAQQNNLSVWRIEPITKALQPLQTLALEGGSIHTIMPLPDGTAIFALTNNGALRIAVDPFTGRLANAAWMAKIPDAHSMALL